jgi:rhodanese-related sulfurtransferase
MRITKYIYLLMIALLCFGCQKEGSKASKIQMISVEEMDRLLDIENVQLVDVRTVAEYQEGHIKEAKNIVYLSESWSAEIAKLDKEDPVYIYCAKGGRSAKCADLLAEAGFNVIYDLEGGITQWKDLGKDVE